MGSDKKNKTLQGAGLRRWGKVREHDVIYAEEVESWKKAVRKILMDYL